MVERVRRWVAAGLEPVDGTSLAVVRAGYGAMLAWEGWRYIDHTRITRYFTGDDRFHFTYWPFDFVQPVPQPWGNAIMVVMIVAGLATAVGLFTRVSLTVAWLSLTWLFLLDKARYLNHLYLMILFGIVLLAIPTANAWSLDARRRGGERTVPAWTVWLVRAQVGIPYTFAAIAKLNADWFDGRPLGGWIADEGDFPIIGVLFDDRWFVLVMAVGAFLIDFVVVGFLLHRRTRPWAYLVAVGFHVANARLFSIGIFPWMMILATTVFFDPDWPRRLVATLRARRDRRRGPTQLGAVVGAVLAVWISGDVVVVHALSGAVAGALTTWVLLPGPPEPRPRRRPARGRGAEEAPPADATPPPLDRRRRIGVALLTVWLLTQVLVPFRHIVIPGNVNWTEDGHRFSWRMKLRQKSADIAHVVVDPSTGTRWTFDYDELDLDDKQVRTMASRPDMIVQLAHEIERRAGRDLEVYAESTARLNGRERQTFIRPDVDLTAVPWPFWRAWFVVPLGEVLDDEPDTGDDAASSD